MKRLRVIAAWVVAAAGAAAFAQSPPAIPAVPRELRAAWCATVTNIDWPTATGQSVSTQQTKLRQHMDALVLNNMNCMYLQIRPACDAFYTPGLEPWSQWLTGTQGNSPGYDPLAFAITEAKARGLELHAWVNPYRAALDLINTNKAATHVCITHPSWVIAYTDNRRYLDMGQSAVRTYIESVIQDIVTRYDIDGVVFDDYFYPGTDFNDTATYNAYTGGGGSMTLANWRRDNVNKLIQECSTVVHNARVGCQFEVGPFGIWRPNNPTGISGADYYATHYCDSKLWLNNGWVDSLSPQIYWSLASSGQPFGALLDWWVSQSLVGRPVFASTADYKMVSDPTNFPSGTEIVNQVIRTKQGGGLGTVHYSMKHITGDQSGVATGLRNGPYAKQALKPATPWLDPTPPAAPNVNVGPLVSGNRTVSFAQPGGAEAARWWLLHTWDGTTWTLQILPGVTTSKSVAANVTDVAVTAVDKAGNESSRTRLSVPVTLSRFELSDASDNKSSQDQHLK